MLLLGGFRENETRTLSLIAKMGAYPSFHEPSTRFSRAFTRFRTVVRVVVATKRMQFLVAKAKKSVRQVIESVDLKSKSHKNSQSVTKSLTIDRQHDVNRQNYQQSDAYHRVLSRFETDNGSSSCSGDIFAEAKDASFPEIYAGNVDTTVPNHTDSRVYSAFDYQPTDMVTHGAHANSDLSNRFIFHDVHK